MPAIPRKDILTKFHAMIEAGKPIVGGGAGTGLSAKAEEAGGIGATMRAAIERIIDQTAPRLAVMRDDAERRRLIDAEVRRVRWMLRRELPRALRRMRSAGVKGEKSE